MICGVFGGVLYRWFFFVGGWVCARLIGLGTDSHLQMSFFFLLANSGSVWLHPCWILVVFQMPLDCFSLFGEFLGCSGLTLNWTT